MTLTFRWAVIEKFILIHTSVKLVTSPHYEVLSVTDILIHTSVKLVTAVRDFWGNQRKHFNPHEREARDVIRGR